ncbi:MAG: HAMP domain-containing sensor histidine kinase [Anaerolineae bacterium]|nr:HAMP domain-containing histidine kinase [Candidatus Roseilinea sp.]MDW8448789.1 HAMP domain-containing sensor histidine kinase [Anaerolineae bacterium]
MYRIIFDLWCFALLTMGVVTLVVMIAWLSYRYGQRQNRTWQSALAELPIGVMLFDQARQRRFANIAAETLAAQLDIGALDRLCQAAAPNLRQSTVLRSSDGQIVQAQAIALPNAGYTLVTLWDLSQRQQSEASYRKLIRTLSHELLTPLTALQGHLAHIASSISDAEQNDASWLGSLEISREEVDRLTRLVSNLLLLARLEAGQPLQRRPTNLGAVAEEVVLSMLGPADERQITLELNAEPRLPRPLVDRDAWKQVFLNLIDNGIKYGRPGGRVTVTLRRADGRVCITVSDDGPGISPEDLPHIFDELYRGDAQRRVRGSGLGLAIVRQIVEQHGGQITCESAPGRGATFRIQLPLQAADVTAA